MTDEKIIKDDEMVRLFIIDKYNLRKDLGIIKAWYYNGAYHAC